MQLPLIDDDSAPETTHEAAMVVASRKSRRHMSAAPWNEGYGAAAIVLNLPCAVQGSSGQLIALRTLLRLISTYKPEPVRVFEKTKKRNGL